MYPVARGYSTCFTLTRAGIRLNKGSKLLGRGSGGGSTGSCKFCGEFGVDEFLDGGDLDVVSGTEREDEDGFAVERDATGKITVQPRLY